MNLRFHAVRACAVLVFLFACCLADTAVSPAHADPGSSPSWGAIAAISGSYGFSYNHPSRDAAERAARAQCDRTAGRPGTCVVRAYFDRSCGALATGNYGEWGAAIAPTASTAGKAAVTECDNHLPTEPCKMVVSVCSPR
jgi:hypothetical protein